MTHTAFFQGPDALANNRDLLRQIERGKAFLASLSPEVREAYFADQRRRSVMAEMAAPSEDATVMAQQGCVCPPGAEKTCQGPLCPRRGAQW